MSARVGLLVRAVARNLHFDIFIGCVGIRDPGWSYSCYHY